jgi:hypothetical protein
MPLCSCFVLFFLVMYTGWICPDFLHVECRATQRMNWVGLGVGAGGYLFKVSSQRSHYRILLQ